jgi:outer membrane protein
MVVYAVCGGVNSVAGAAPLEASTAQDPPELRLSLREAMDASVDQNPTVRLFNERITQAQDVADTQLGELLPNISGRVKRCAPPVFYWAIWWQPYCCRAAGFL